MMIQRLQLLQQVEIANESYDVYLITTATPQKIGSNIPLNSSWETPSYGLNISASLLIYPTNGTIPNPTIGQFCLSNTGNQLLHFNPDSCLTCSDNDGDGICNTSDCDANNPSIPAVPGTPCNNGTGTIEADGCTCNTTGGGNSSTLWTETTAPLPTGIFTTSKTFVENILTAQKVIVQTDVYADYVFEKDYSLLPLPKLEQYIQKNHHLPNIPSATEIVAKGIDVSEMSVKHMEKIEELTLYLLQMNKRLEQVEKENKRLKKALKKRK